MSRSPLFRNLTCAMQIVLYCEKHKILTSQGLEQLAALKLYVAQWRASRCKFMALTSVSAFGAVVGHINRTYVALPKLRLDVKVAIIGAGLAGFTCGYEFKKNISATLYGNRVGGRCFSLGSSFPRPVNFRDQFVEQGGNIDNFHKTRLGYTRQFRLTLEDVNKQLEEIFYCFNGQHYPESVVVNKYRNLVAANQGLPPLVFSATNAITSLGAMSKSLKVCLTSCKGRLSWECATC